MVGRQKRREGAKFTVPDMEGVEALREIRKADPGAKVIMCTAMRQKNEIIESIKWGRRRLHRQADPGPTGAGSRYEGAIQAK